MTNRMMEYLFHERSFIAENIWTTHLKMELPYKTLNIRKCCSDRTMESWKAVGDKTQFLRK
jgi:hypothetical protein